MTTLLYIAAGWAGICLIALAFNHGAHRKTREERRIRMMEEANG